MLAPPVAAHFDYQIGGAFRPAASARIVDRDRHSAPAEGRYGVCYVNAFQAQPEETGFWRTRHPDLILDAVDRQWNERLLDTSTPAKRTALAAVVGRWIDGCRAKGYDAVEPDNLDSWTRSRGALTKADNVSFAKLIVARAHADGLAIAQKNTPQLGREGRRIGFDFAIAEECGRYDECGRYTSVYGRRVIEIEYDSASFRAACRARGGTISITLRDRLVRSRGAHGYVDRSC